MFNILKEVLCGVVFNEEAWGGVAAAALVKAYKAIFIEVIEGCDSVCEAVAGSAVKIYDGVAFGVAV